ncbi:PREDICTED: sodium/potassium-transporting ATPase subunit alpha-1-like [Branchiostoma belcheri]|uniref:Sodium/potassium-transporting ATPase subunit alpha-1-like n=1 Tax=Branchiostoma belcheri TaxID=7741 RepID=A0A6P5A8K7_BRABE|nr:PREDICTED: sodium/potassium-transporting ATPase subunit alpha-1-like [Branchiostoma belcheri]
MASPTKEKTPKPASGKSKSKGKEKKETELEDLKQELDIDDHMISLEEFCTRYNTSTDVGLTRAMAAEVFERDGPNCLIPPRKTPKWVKDFVKDMFPKQTLVIRSGEPISVDIENVVVGDLVQLKGGDRIPADVRIVEADGFKIDISLLTGESEPQIRSPEFTNDNPFETRNIALFCTVGVEGSAKGIVFNTGNRMVMAPSALRVSRLDLEETPSYCCCSS